MQNAYTSAHEIITTSTIIFLVTSVGDMTVKENWIRKRNLINNKTSRLNHLNRKNNIIQN